jgi:Zn-dependent oligopeptidase
MSGVDGDMLHMCTPHGTGCEREYVLQWAPAGQAVRLPVAHMVCNQTPPVGNAPSLMTFREVETLFHEFGHALQHMLTTVEEGMVSGIRGVEWDAVELPSQFMENWCYDFPTLMSFAKHHETGEPLPKDLFDKLKAAKYVSILNRSSVHCFKTSSSAAYVVSGS